MKLVKLTTITEPTAITELTTGDSGQLAELQTALARLGYPVGEIDGEFGPKTRNAWAEFKIDIFQGNPDLIGQGSIAKLQELIDAIGDGKIHDFSTNEGTIAAIKWECKSMGIGLSTQVAYVLATVEWETAQTFKPVREAFFVRPNAEEWRKNNLRYHPYYGRGYVQLTWKTNYSKYSSILGVDLVNNPDLVMEPNISLFVLVHGFKTGAFTDRKITDYITESKTDFINARRCINGRDKAHEIAEVAERYLRSL